jgi:hypothetical protein
MRYDVSHTGGARTAIQCRGYRLERNQLQQGADNWMKDFSNHFRELVERLLPDDPRILIPLGGSDMMILATWRLSTDPSRPNKRSRMLRIAISEEALDDYARGSDGVRLASDNRFVAWLRHQLGHFDPNHDTPLGVEPPAETWSVSTLDLNG